MMRGLLIILLILLQTTMVAQNLVRNASFEDTLWCPYNTMQINAAQHWFSPQWGGGGTSELFHTCNNTIYPPWSPGIVGVPNNAFGFQMPRTGNAYAGFSPLYNTWSWEREYIEGGLIEALNPLRTYYVEFWVSLANAKGIAISNIGVHFSKDTVLGFYLAHLVAYVEWQGPPITDTMNWVKISGYFRPNEDGVRFITVGNFQETGQTNYTILNTISTGCYYFFDDFLVVDSTSHANGIMERENLEGVRVFPNPAEDELFLHFARRTENDMVFCLYDITGRLLLSRPLPSGQEEFYIDVSTLKSGLYVYRINGKNGSKSGKVVKRE